MAAFLALGLLAVTAGQIAPGTPARLDGTSRRWPHLTSPQRRPPRCVVVRAHARRPPGKPSSEADAPAGRPL